MADYFPAATANPKVTQALMDHLVRAFEAFADLQAAQSPEGLGYVDALMGCHNFYKAVIFDLERRTGDDRNVFRRTAVDTLALGVARE